MTKNTIDNIGSLFRFITPALLALLGGLILSNLGNIKTTMDKLDSHFTNHLSEHKTMEKEFEHRFTKLEGLIENHQ